MSLASPPKRTDARWTTWFESKFNATGDKNHGRAVDVIATLVAYVIIFVKMNVITAKDCKNTPSVMTYAFGNYIHAEA